MMVLFGQSSGPVEPFDPQVLAQKGSLFLTRPTLGHYIASRAELLERAGQVLGWVADGVAHGPHRPRVPPGPGGRRAPRARGTPHDRQGAAHPVTPAGADGPLPALVSTAWLAERLGRPGLRVLDASWYLPIDRTRTRAPNTRAGHIPGALFFDLDATSDRASPLPHMLPAAAAVRAADVRAGPRRR